MTLGAECSCVGPSDPGWPRIGRWPFSRVGSNPVWFWKPTAERWAVPLARTLVFPSCTWREHQRYIAHLKHIILYTNYTSIKINKNKWIPFSIHTQKKLCRKRILGSWRSVCVYVLGLRYDWWENVASLLACLVFYWICLFNGRKHGLTAVWVLVGWVGFLMESVRISEKPIFSFSSWTELPPGQADWLWTEMGDVEFDLSCWPLRKAVEAFLSQKGPHLPILWLHKFGAC